MKVFSLDRVDYLLAVLFIVLTLLLNTVNSNRYFGKDKVILLAQSASDLKIAFWNGLLKEHPTYIVGWYELYSLNTEAGNFNAAEDAFRKMKLINPNYERDR